MFKFDDLKTTNLPISAAQSGDILRDCIKHVLWEHLGVERSAGNVAMILRLIYLANRLGIVSNLGYTSDFREYHRTLADFVSGKGFDDLFPKGDN